MKEHPYARMIRRGYECAERGDLETLSELMAPDAVWHEPGCSPLAGDYKGPEEVLGFLRDLRRRSDGTFAVEIEAILTDPERVVVLQRESAERDGDILDELAAVDFEIHRGQVTEVTVYHTDCARFDAFFA